MFSSVIYAGYGGSDIAEETQDPSIAGYERFFCNDHFLNNPHDHMHRKKPVLYLNLHFSFNSKKKIMISRMNHTLVDVNMYMQ